MRSDKNRNRLWITGASGFLGWNICRYARREWETHGTYRSHPVKIRGVATARLDLTENQALDDFLKWLRPTAVIHTAAAADPNFCQQHRHRTRFINTDAAVGLAQRCADLNIPYLFTSTDLVFNGRRPPYAEDDPVSPICTYGEQKVAAEKGILACHPQAAVCRMPLMFGPAPPANGSFMQPTLAALRSDRPLKLFVDEIRTPISAKSAADGILALLGRTSGILHLGGAESISRYELGRLVARVFDLPAAGIIPRPVAGHGMPAPRSADVSLTNEKAKALGFNPRPLKQEFGELVGKV